MSHTMIENQKTNKDGCCHCCGHPIRQEWLFREQHNVAWREQLRYYSFRVADYCYGKDYGLCYGYDATGDWCPCVKIDKPKALANWENHNPRPEIGMREFVVQLHGRIAALEAQLAEKGGKQ